LGPISLFDKSFLQSLKLDESVWFDHFFLSNVCPLFYVETLADLEKTGRRGRTAKEEVRIIAGKFPQMNSAPCSDHHSLCIDSLLGYDIPMTGQIPLDQAKLVMHKGSLNVFAQESPVTTAFSRWQEGRFHEVEGLFAKDWRNALSNLGLEEIAEMYKTFGIDPKSCKSFAQAKSLAQTILSETASPDLRIDLAFDVLSVPIEDKSRILSRWQSKGCPSLKEFAPYSAFVLSIELFFNIALAAGLISTKHPSNLVDIGYLFYIPFCMLFISSDRLHRQTAPLFLRDNQEFVWGPDLKSALSEINQYFSSLPDSEKEKGIMGFAGVPPHGAGILVEQLWNRHIPRWRITSETPHPSRGKSFKEIVNKVREIEHATPFQSEPTTLRVQDIESVTIKRRVSKKRGSWYQIPKGIGKD